MITYLIANNWNCLKHILPGSWILRYLGFHELMFNQTIIVVNSQK